MSQKIIPPFWHPAHTGAFILDWDGVLADTRLDFKPLRRKYFEGKIVPLIEAAASLPAPLCEEVRAEIRRIEIEGAEKAVPIEGAHDLIAWLNAAGKPWAVVSRNCRDSILTAAERCGITLPAVLLSREDPHVKPEPEALALAASRLGVNLADCLMVGDFIYDILGARRAAIRAILVQRSGMEWEHLADLACPTMKDLVQSLSDPKPLVPWEYRELAEKRGVDHLRAVSRKTFLLQEFDGAFRQAAELAKLGAIHFVVHKDAKIGIEDWKESSLPARSIDMPLHVLLQDVMTTRWPCLRITVASGDVSRDAVEVPRLYGTELEHFLIDSL